MSGIDLDELPTNYTINLKATGDHNQPITIDAGLEDIGIGITGNAFKPVAIDLGLDDVNVHLDDLNLALTLKGDPKNPIAVDLGLDNVKIDLGLDNINVCLSLGLTEIPRIRLHLPTKYEFGFSLFGLKIFNFIFAGETMLVTEDNPPRLFQRPVAPHTSAQRRADVAESEQPTVRVVLSDAEVSPPSDSVP
jgi:hypothetical protein